MLCFLSQIENGKLSDHEHSSTMEHLHLLLPMVLSMNRVRADGAGAGEWQEDSGLGLYRAPEEGVHMAGGAAAFTHSVDLEKKVILMRILDIGYWILEMDQPRFFVSNEALSRVCPCSPDRCPLWRTLCAS